MAVDWKRIDAQTRAELRADGLSEEDCLPVAQLGDKPGEPLTREMLEQMFTPSERYLELAAESDTKED